MLDKQHHLTLGKVKQRGIAPAARLIHHVRSTGAIVRENTGRQSIALTGVRRYARMPEVNEGNFGSLGEEASDRHHGYC